MRARRRQKGTNGGIKRERHYETMKAAEATEAISRVETNPNVYNLKWLQWLGSVCVCVCASSIW